VRERIVCQRWFSDIHLLAEEDMVAGATESALADANVASIDEMRNQVVQGKAVAVEEAQKASIAVEAARHEKQLRTESKTELQRCKTEAIHQKSMFARKLEIGKSNQIREVSQHLP